MALGEGAGEAGVAAGPELRPFPTQVAGAIDAALAALPPEAHGAVIGYADDTGADLAVAAKLGRGWSFAGNLERTWTDGEVSGQVAVRFTW